MARRAGTGVLLFLTGLLALAVIVVLLLVGPLNPFGTETKDRSQPVLLKSLQDLSDYHAATANMQVVVDVEQDARLLPSFIKGERTLFVAAGNVDAAVDFRALSKDPDAVKVSKDRRSVEVRLTAAGRREADHTMAIVGGAMHDCVARLPERKRERANQALDDLIAILRH